MPLTQDEFIFDAIVGIVGFAGIFFLLLVLVRAQYSFRVQLRRKLIDRYQTLLPAYLLAAGEEQKKLFQEIKKLTRTKKAANILLDEITFIYSNFSGEMAAKARQLFDDMALHKIGLQNLKSHILHHRKHGLLQLSVMDYQEAYPLIARLRRSTNKDVRRKARIASIRLRKKQALLDLKDEMGAFSEWSLVSIVSILEREHVKLTKDELNQLRAAENKYVQSLVPHLERKIALE